MGDEFLLIGVFLIIVLLMIYKLLSRGEYTKDIFLGPGTWVVGIDIPPGKGDLIAESGSGDFVIKEKGSKAWSHGNKIGVTSSLQPSRFRNLCLNAGDTLEINGNVNILITAPVPIRDITDEALGPGNYVFGVDVPAGKYDLEVLSGDGPVYTFEKPGDKNYSFYQDMALGNDLKAHEYANLRCAPGSVLWIEGSLQIRLTHSAKQEIWL